MKRRVLCVLLLLLLLPGQALAESGASLPELTDYAGLRGKTVSMLTGAPFEELVRSKAPDVGEFSFFNNMPDMLLALKSGKTDAALINNAIAVLAVNRDSELALFPQNLQDGAFGFAFAKGDPRRDEWQAAYDAIPQAEIEAAWEKWTGADESVKALPKQDWPCKNGTVRVAACDTLEPMSYAGAGGALMGFDLEVLLMIARALDVRVEVTGMEFSAILASVQAGKADVGVGSIIITPERAESVDFVEYYPAAFVLIVRGTRADGAGTGLEALAHARAAVQTGTVCGDIAQASLPDIKLEYYNTQTDCLTALLSGKTDFWATDEPIARSMMIGNEGLEIIGRFEDNSLAAIFPKSDAGQALCEQYSAFVGSLWADGTMAEIDGVWFGADEDAKTLPDYASLPDINGTLRMAADSAMPPFVYVKDDRPVGYDIDIAARFCAANGYRLEVVLMDFGGVLPAVQSGKCDFAACCITVTEERAQSVLFSTPNYHSGTVAVVRKSGDAAAKEGFWGGVVSSFEKTFLRESRWKLFAEGVLTTLLITVLSILFGTALGFLVFLLCRSGNAFANGAARFCVWLVQGMPMVVLLMILYYIVFGSVAVSGLLVAVLGFTLTFGAAVFGLLKMGVGAIDRGQYEAACAMGYSSRRTFFRIILPQAVPHILPAYKGEIVGLIKATAIVGYIAVQDLTKMGDIVRSRTYEAFFPLIAVTVIYFVLEALLAFLVSKLQLRADPKKRSPERILKGVDRHD